MASDCEHCPDGHSDPTSRPWGVFVAPERDSDGQPTHLWVAPTAGQHVAESDAEWVRKRLNTREITREVLKNAIDDAWYDADIDGWGDEGAGYDTGVLADAVLALLNGAHPVGGLCDDPNCIDCDPDWQVDR